MKIKVLSGLILLALLGVGYFLSTKPRQVTSAQAQKQAPPIEVTIYTVKYEKVIFTKDLSGRTSAFQMAEIRPQVSGIILKRLFTEGSLVKKGQQLYQIDPATYQAEYDRSVASLAQAEADLEAVGPKAVRYDELLKVGFVTRQDYDDVMASLSQVKAGIKVAKANVATAKINLNYTKVFAPISGRIGRSFVTEGALVTMGQAAVMAVIQNLTQIYVDVNQSSSDMMNLRKHMTLQNPHSEAVLILNDRNDIYGSKGKILFSDVTVGERTGMVHLRILFPNPDGELLPGLFVKARVEQSIQDNAITVPQQSVVRTPDGRVMVWAVDETGTVNTRQITVSQAIGNKWLVNSGLKPGDKVVVEGLQKISPMAKVTFVETQPSHN